MSRAPTILAPRTARRFALVGAALLALIACRPTPDPVPPTGGAALLSAAPDARYVVGTLRNVRQLDVHAYSATLAVERDISPTQPAGATRMTRGTEVRLLWEELSTGRAVRLADETPVLIAIVPPPGASLWRSRLAALGDGPPTYGIAASGDAFQGNPQPRDIEVVSQFLALAAVQRVGPDGVDLLVTMLTESSGDLPQAAASSLGEVADLSAQLTEANRRRILRTIADDKVDMALRRRVVDLISSHRIVLLGPELRRLAKSTPELRAELWRATATLAGGLAAEDAKDLLQDSAPGVRAVAAAYAPFGELHEELAVLLRSDSAEEVRAAALERLARGGGAAVLDQLLPGLADASAAVRIAAAHAVGRLGDNVVPLLESRVASVPVVEAQATILALDQTGSAAGRTAIARIAANDARPEVRGIAELALGKLEGDRH